ILFLAEKEECLPRKRGNVEYANFMDAYSAKLIEVVRKGTGKSAPLFGKRIIVDASNGAGGFFVKNVLQQLGAITDGSINVEPDGDFPAHAPNPEDPKAINALREAVLENRAELGIIFDADVDRAAVVDGNGTLINRDNLIAVTAVTVVGDKPASIVTDSVTIDGLSEFIRSIGGKHVRYKRGYKNVIDEAKRRNEIGEYCPLAIETSGHAAFLENYFLDDGAYLICKLLVAHANQTAKREKLSDLIATMDHPVEENEVRVKFNENSVNFKREGERVLQEIKFFANLDKKIEPLRRNYEGVRMNFPEGHGDGWTLIRMSVHDPVMPINFASRKAGGNKKMASQLYYILEKYPFLDVSSLKQFISEDK
ncbi:MAG: phosphomannomutase/phosphoglucomutase, partial [Clostridia bacterium]|nr:phosphomannomutase/phosphoglucomutase [Clostridia bacterium]